MKILVGGCSFSETRLNFNQKSWTDILSEEYDVTNLAKSHYGQSKICLSIIEELIKGKFNYDLVLIQLSAFGRGFAIDEKDFVERILKDNLLEFAPYIHEYSKNGLESGYITNDTTKISNEFVKYSLLLIYMLMFILDSKKINYKMFYGWRQIDGDIINSNQELVNSIHSSDNFWIYKNYGGMMEYIKDTAGQSGIDEDDFHLNELGNELFYKKIKKILKEKSVL